MMRKGYNLLVVCILLIVWQACTPPTDVQKALVAAGDNRIELELVLSHYERNSEGHAAAEFLISNMLYHSAMVSEELDQYNQELMSVNLDSRNSIDDCRRLYDSLARTHVCLAQNIRIVPDVQHITADYLIAHIDTALAIWHRSPWAQHLSFDEFCEYLLPYRIGREPLETWMPPLYEKYAHRIEWLLMRDNWRNSTFYACLYLNDQLKKKGFHVEDFCRWTIDFPPSVLETLRMASCRDYAASAAFVFRACGIPVSIDYVIQWPFRSQNHTWNSVYSDEGFWYPFMGGESNPDRVPKPNTRKGKVYRKTFAYQKSSLFHDNQKYVEPLPPTLNTPFIKDVSSLYFIPHDVTVRLSEKPHHDTRYVYLCVFDNQEWVPIHWTKHRSGKATFTSIEHNVVYYPMYYSTDGLQPAANPFLLTIDGSMKTLVPDIAQHQTLALNRKFPRFNGVLGYSERMVNGVIEAAHHADFSDAIHVDSILRNPQMAYDTLHVYVSEAFRYWRFRADKDCICNVAELQFYNDSLCLNSVGTAIGATAISNTYAVEKAFDHIDVSYYEAAEHGGWIGLDFGESMPVNRIIYLPRNDDNNISVGDSYELIYWDATGYHSLGKKVASTNRLIYDDVPGNALFTLRNLTKGKEERIFTYENGKQVWL